MTFNVYIRSDIIMNSFLYLQLLSKAKVHQLHISDLIQQQILRLEIAVDDSSGVQIFKGLDDARGVEARRGVVKVAAVPGRRR